MIIKKIIIENYLCYYGINTITLENGLNIILGENNEGKTKCFEAVEWLFDDTKFNPKNLISAKKAAEISPGDNFKVSVSIAVEYINTQYKLSRSFIVGKQEDDDLYIQSIKFDGEETNSTTGERVPENAQVLLDRIFPYQIRKYSMFKGETELNIFENNQALANLINLFSAARHYEMYVDKSKYLRNSAEKAVESSLRKSKKSQREYDTIQQELVLLGKSRESLITLLEHATNEKSKLTNEINNFQANAQIAEEINIINNRIFDLEKKIDKIDSQIDFNYTTALFDDHWILVHFTNIHREFETKIYEQSKKRREIQSESDRQKGIQKGIDLVRSGQIDISLPLPDNIPPKAIMEEMLGEYICKVCNRPAKPNGTEEEKEAYQFMKSRLNNNIEGREKSIREAKDGNNVFKHNYIYMLEHMSTNHTELLQNINSISDSIKENVSFIQSRQNDKFQMDAKLKHEKDNLNRLVANANISDPSSLNRNYKNFLQHISDLESASENAGSLSANIEQIEQKIAIKKLEKDKISFNTASKFYTETMLLLRDIERIFKDTKESKIDEFIRNLEDKSNDYMDVINVEAFTGKIKFTRKGKGENRMHIDVALVESGGRGFVAGTAVRTSMNISILLAISELANEVRHRSYPMIFDAPTSSFGETKTAEFLNLIYKTSGQKILFLKDFIGSIKNADGQVADLFIKDDFSKVRRDKALWVKLERPFDKNDLSTINTKVIYL